MISQETARGIGMGLFGGIVGNIFATAFFGCLLAWTGARPLSPGELLAYEITLGVFTLGLMYMVLLLRRIIWPERRRSADL